MKTTSKTIGRKTVAALAGRRIDAPNTENARFPLSNIDFVNSKISSLIDDESITDLVCSAACGADLLAISMAIEKSLSSYIILPFEPDIFYETSVIDRPGEWEEVYWSAIKTAINFKRLIIMSNEKVQENPYSTVTKEIIRFTASLSESIEPLAIAVWDGASRGEDDATDEFRRLALSSGFRLIDLSTL